MRLINFFYLFLLAGCLNAKAASNYQTPNMNLTIPVPGQELGPAWANDINGSLTLIDAHNHTPGNGVQVPPSGLNINSNLSFQGNFITNLGGGFFTIQLSDPLTNASVYTKGVDLYYKDGNGNVIQITSGGGVNGSPGSISNLSSPASASYVSANGTFVWQQDTNTAANMDAASLIIRYPGSYPSISGNYIEISAPTSLATGYQFTLPANTPASNNSYLTSSTAGVLSYTTADQVAVDMSSTGANNVAATMTSVGANDIAAKISSGTLTGSQLQNNANFPGDEVQEDALNVLVSSTNAATSLKVIRGTCSGSGTTGSGEGFSCSLNSTGSINVFFTTAFASVPIVICTTGDGLNAVCSATGVTTSLFNSVTHTANTGALSASSVQFIAIGPR